MKKILIPTDFSVNAGYAVIFGTDMAADIDAAVALFHAFQVPMLPEPILSNPDMRELLQAEEKEVMQKIATRIRDNHPGLVVETQMEYGLEGDTIIEFSKSGLYDLIVMGSKGAGNRDQIFFGNIANTVVKRSDIPVLLVPPGASYKPIKKIALASHKTNLMTQKTELVISEFVKSYHAEFHIIDVIREVAGSLLDDKGNSRAFEDLHPSVHVIEDEKVVHAVNLYAAENDIDVVIMISEKHTLFERIFTEIHTLHMTRETQKPLLIIRNS